MTLVLFVSFILTLLIEVAILAAFVRTAPTPTALYAFLINALTWPIANLLYASFPMPATAIAIEGGVILAEAGLISSLLEIGGRK